MGRCKEIVARHGTGVVRLSYVKSRKVLRVTSWEDNRAMHSLEIALDAMLDQLDIEPADLAVPVRYLLFAGRHDQPRGGSDDLVCAFDSELAARDAFRELRGTRSNRDGWAELTALDCRGRLTRLAWFGRRVAPRRGVRAGVGLGRRVRRSRRALEAAPVSAA